jgi:hypothetical protein
MFSIAKAVMSWMVYSRCNRLHGAFSNEIFKTVETAMPYGYSGVMVAHILAVRQASGMVSGTRRGCRQSVSVYHLGLGISMAAIPTIAPSGNEVRLRLLNGQRPVDSVLGAWVLALRLDVPD